MEFLDEDTRPRFIFQSRPPSQNSPQKSQLNKSFLFITLSLSSILLVFSIFFLQTEPFKSLLLWVSLSFLIGPFAPSRLTGGDVRVGQGPIIEPPDEEEEDEEEKPEISAEKRGSRKRSKWVRSDATMSTINLGTPVIERANGSSETVKSSELLGKGSVGDEEEMEWNKEDLIILKKQMAKNPAGKPGRWEVISEAYNGRHKVESVIKKAKELGEMKLSDGGGDYERFLKNRKPLDVRVRGETGAELGSGESGKNDGGGGAGVGWSAGEDIALLNALKAFPKDVAMRWEKVAAAVPGKSKPACMKRVADLKRDFRISKTNATEADA